MRLKRDDLVSKFEEIVKQEIVNHNRSIEATNLAILNINTQINKIVSDNAKYVAQQENALTLIERSIEKLSFEFQRLQQYCTIKVESIEEKLTATNNEIEKNLNLTEQTYLDASVYISGIDEIRTELRSLKIELEKQKIVLQSSLRDLSSQFKESIITTKNELLQIPDGSNDVKQELEKRIEEQKLNAETILKEIRVYRKETFVLEKKIENLYSLIDRLKKGVTS